jgi:hypothetical protein
VSLAALGYIILDEDAKEMGLSESLGGELGSVVVTIFLYSQSITPAETPRGCYMLLSHGRRLAGAPPRNVDGLNVEVSEVLFITLYSLSPSIHLTSPLLPSPLCRTIPDIDSNFVSW